MGTNHEEAVSRIYDFVRAQGYKLTAFSITDRHNRHGAYSVAEMTLIIPREKTGAEAQKDEVNTHEIQQYSGSI